MSLLFYDFEVFRHNWLMVAIEPGAKKQTVIVDDREQLEEFFNAHKRHIWVGYNNVHYDQYILKAILCGFNPWDMNNWIINRKKAGWQFSKVLREINFINFDVGTRTKSLKQYEAFMGNSIKESGVSFDIDRPLTEEEINETIQYCIHDVEQTVQVFLHTRKVKFEARRGLINAFKLPLSCYAQTDAQLAARILGADYDTYDDEFDTKILPPTLQLSDRYKHVVDFFINAKEDTFREMQEETRRINEEVIPPYEAEKAAGNPGRTQKQREEWEKKMRRKEREIREGLAAADWTDKKAFRKWFYSRNLKTEVAGVPHKFAWGGIHGALSQYTDKGRLILADVSSLYPSLMIRYKYFSRSIDDPQKYIDIYEANLEMKKSGDPRRPAYKLVCNTVYGALKASNGLYDPLMGNCIIIAGQLLILDLIEKLEDAGCCKLEQSNTDGILFKVDTAEDEERARDIIHAWEIRTGLNMEFGEYHTLYQANVNNYVLIGDKEVERVGGYVKELSPIDNDLPIVNKAVVDYLLYGIHPAETISACDDLWQFQKVVRIKGDYLYAIHNGQRLTEKTHRVFASTRQTDGDIRKVKPGENPQKFSDTSKHCFIDNTDVKGKKCPPYLCKNFYINMALTRLTDPEKGFGLVIE